MTTEMVIDIIRSALLVVVKASMPMLIVALVVGLVISIIQTVTSIQEQTLTFVPKLLAIFLVLAIAGSFIFGTVTEYTIDLYSNFNLYIK